MRDGTRPRVHLPPGLTQEEAQKLAREMSELERAPKPTPPSSPATAETTLAPNAPLRAWAKLHFAERRRRGLTGVRQDENRYDFWIDPFLGDIPAAALTPDHLESLVALIDEAQREGYFHPKTRELREISHKTGAHVWGVMTAMCSEMCESKNRQLRGRARGDNPAEHVRGPDSGPERVCGWIYPCEMEKLLACERVPMRRREVYALGAYLYLRPGELEVLGPDDVDLLGKLVNVYKAADRSKGGEATKLTKTALARKVPIPPTLRPLLERLCREAKHEGRDRLVDMPPLCELSSRLRAALKLAGVDRAELYADEEARRQIRFYDLRSTGITWLALGNVQHLAIQAFAGHTSFKTTSKYIKAATGIGLGNIGEPFGPLPVGMSSTEAPSVPLLPAPTTKAKPTGVAAALPRFAACVGAAVAVACAGVTPPDPATMADEGRSDFVQNFVQKGLDSPNFAQKSGDPSGNRSHMEKASIPSDPRRPTRFRLPSESFRKQKPHESRAS